MNLFRNLIRWATVDRTGALLQLRHFGEGLIARVEHQEPQGVHFGVPVGAQGIVVAPGGVSSEAVALGMTGAQPAGELAPGEGGLHYLGTFKVFLSDDGKVSLGEQMPGDWVALASLVDARISALQQKIDTHTHPIPGLPVVGGGGGTAGPGTTSAILAPVGPQASVASTNVRSS